MKWKGGPARFPDPKGLKMFQLLQSLLPLLHTCIFSTLGEFMNEIRPEDEFYIDYIYI